MFLQPKKIRYKKVKKGRLTKYTFKNNLNFGTIGLKTVKSGFVSAKHLETARQAIINETNKKGKLWIKIFPNLPVTRKPSETRMGKGKGSFSHWIAKIRKGSIIFEICGVNKKVAVKAFKIGASKLPLKTQIFS